MRSRARIYEACYGNVTLIGPVVTGRTCNDSHFIETLLEVWMRLVPRNTSTTTARGTKYKQIRVQGVG